MILLKRLINISLFLYIGLALTGCSYMPSDGPSTSSVTSSNKKHDFELIPITSNVTSITYNESSTNLIDKIGKGRRSKAQVISSGDILKVSIWEPENNGLFSDAKGNTNINASVDESGMIFLPYAGNLHVAGKTPSRARKLIQKRLEKETLRPQVNVELIQKNNRDQIAVTGDVKNPGMYSLNNSDGSGRLIELISAAGGAVKESYRTIVSVIRSGKKGEVNLEKLYKDPKYDINLMPGDRVVLSDNPRTFSVLGAVSKSGQYDFIKTNFKLIHALSIAGGLVDQRANRTGVFLFRVEDRRTVNSIRRADKGKLVASNGDRVRVIYQLNLQDPKSVFHAREFAMRDNDVIYVTNAPTHQWSKVLDLFNKTVGGYRNTVTGYNLVSTN